MKRLGAIAAIAALTIGLAGTAISQEVKPISAKDLEAKIKNNTGKALVVAFFATWCPPCQAEIPGFIELNKAYKDKGVEIIGVSVDTGGIAAVQDFVRTKQIDYPVFLADSDIAAAYGIRGIPDTRIFAPGGRLHKRQMGFAEKAEFEKDISELLK